MGHKGTPRRKVLMKRGVITTGATRQISSALPLFSQGAYVVEKRSMKIFVVISSDYGISVEKHV